MKGCEELDLELEQEEQAVATCPCRLNLICANAKAKRGAKIIRSAINLAPKRGGEREKERGAAGGRMKTAVQRKRLCKYICISLSLSLPAYACACAH